VRPNATSDLLWERSGIIENNPNVLFYDYTKIPSRAMKYITSRAPAFFSSAEYQVLPAYNPPSEWPENYHLTFSYSEVNMGWCLILLAMGCNVTIPFTPSLGKAPWEFYSEGAERAIPVKGWKPTLPETCFGYPVIDGDAYDIRFIDNDYWHQRLGVPPPYIVGLRVKGHFQNRNAYENSFFFDGWEAQKAGNDQSFIATHLIQNMREAKNQKKRNQIPPVNLARTYLKGEVLAAYESERG
jgi:hypothetical protein